MITKPSFGFNFVLSINQKKLEMNITAYEKQFDDILDGTNNNDPYDNEDYVNYVKMNKARMSRWYKKGKISPEITETILKIDQPQNWVLITEPWCGDAAHSHAFIGKLATINPKINLTIQNRDAANSEIEKYLTNGGKSIPKLIVRDEAGNDLFDWGPRPKEAQAIVMEQKNDNTISAEDKKKQLQSWYNKDKGTMIQEELNALFNELN